MRGFERIPAQERLHTQPGAERAVLDPRDPETGPNHQDTGGFDNPQCSDAAPLKPFCHACQAIPAHGYCRLPGCPMVSE